MGPVLGCDFSNDRAFFQLVLVECQHGSTRSIRKAPKNVIPVPALVPVFVAAASQFDEKCGCLTVFILGTPVFPPKEAFAREITSQQPLNSSLEHMNDRQGLLVDGS